MQPGSDFEAVEAGYVSITPIHLDLTDHGSMDLLRTWGFEMDISDRRGPRGEKETA